MIVNELVPPIEMMMEIYINRRRISTVGEDEKVPNKISRDVPGAGFVSTLREVYIYRVAPPYDLQTITCGRWVNERLPV